MPRSPPFHAASSSQAAAAAFDSHPSEVVLIKSYLRPWVAQGVRAAAFVHVADLYSAEPGDLARRYPAAVSREGERAWYFLSPVRTKSPLGRGRRKARTVAGGTGGWRSEGAPKPVLDPLGGNRKVGYRQSFSFMKRGHGGAGAPVRNGWIMVELHLHGGDDGGGDQLEGLVLCKVYRSPRHPESAAAALTDDDGEESCSVAAAPAARHSNADDGVGNSDAPLAAAVAASGGERKADDEEGSSAAAAATPRRHIKNAEDVETSGAAAATAPRIKKRAADDENGNSSGAAAPGLKKRAADDENGNSGEAAAPGLKEMAADEDSSALDPARKRAKTADDEGPGATLAHKNKQAGAPATQLHCPECGFHLGALDLEAVVIPAKSTSETEKRQRNRAVERRVTFQ